MPDNAKSAADILRCLKSELDQFANSGLCWPDPALPKTPRRLLELVSVPLITDVTGNPDQRRDRLAEILERWLAESEKYHDLLCQIVGEDVVWALRSCIRQYQQAMRVRDPQQRRDAAAKALQGYPTPLVYLTEKANTASAACSQILGEAHWIACPLPGAEHVEANRVLAATGLQQAPLLQLWMDCGCFPCWRRLRVAVRTAADLVGQSEQEDDSGTFVPISKLVRDDDPRLKNIHAIKRLIENAQGRVRTKRPKGRDGRSIPNRLLVNEGDLRKELRLLDRLASQYPEVIRAKAADIRRERKRPRT